MNGRSGKINWALAAILFVVAIGLGMALNHFLTPVNDDGKKEKSDQTKGVKADPKATGDSKAKKDGEGEPAKKDAAPEKKAAKLADDIHQFCGDCHRYPPAETFPRSAWKEEVERGYFFSRSRTVG